MAQDNELQRLERFVSSLLTKFNALQEENRQLTERIERRDATIDGLEEDLAGMREERGDISSRVGSLIDKIEEWESASGVNIKEEESSYPSDKAADSAVQGSLFSDDSEDEDRSE
ncbi:MAG: cell division protein ZapB [Proteobacteria bacterium]|nr:cell division protein ZapB [Pseudomonadota bacterium]MBU1060399.1 cell division protein ZapB [Pseudomonadota bacterium]